jgi:hypothetical protein
LADGGGHGEHPPDGGGASDASASSDSSAPLDAGPQDAAVSEAGEACPADRVCVRTFPYHFDGSTLTAPSDALSGYACAPAIPEGGPEWVFQVSVPADGFLSVAVYDSSGVDVDVHILSSWDADTCVSRGDHHARADVSAGTYWIVADTFVSGGVEQSGPFSLDIGFLEPSVGPCEMQTGEMPRVGDDGMHLAMPATGPIVKEAHLVTQEEPQPYPGTPTDELDAHHGLSQARSGLVMHRVSEWAPIEGGSHYGSGIGNPALFPVLHEAWYVNMYWTRDARPDRGTRMILRDPLGSPRAVVVAAGYETGPGNLAHIGGTAEETHFYLGTEHRDPLTLGIATDQTLPMGPRVCSP